jgi:hypothetical protein
VKCREEVNEEEEEEREVIGRLEVMTGDGRTTDPGVLGGGEIADISTEGSDRSFLFLDLSRSAGPVSWLPSFDSAVLIVFCFSMRLRVCVSLNSSVVCPLSAVSLFRSCVSASTRS